MSFLSTILQILLTVDVIDCSMSKRKALVSLKVSIPKVIADRTDLCIVERLFKKGWRHRKKDRPQVQFIFKVLWTDALLEPYLAYRYTCSAFQGRRAQLRLHRSAIQKTLNAPDKRGNEHLLFHGTNRACMLGECRSDVLLCSLQTCSLCSILRTSFDVSKCGEPLRPLHPCELALHLQGSKNTFKRYAERHSRAM